MAGQSIDFKNGGDTGLRTDTGAIEPYVDAEPVDANVLNRPNENLRYRSEVLRTAGEESKYLHDVALAWMITAGDEDGIGTGETLASVAFNKDGDTASKGTFITSHPIVIQPVTTPAADVKEVKQYSFASTVPTLSATFNFTAELAAHEGMNWREIVWEAVDEGDIAPDNAKVIVEGSPLSRIRIQVKDDWTTQVQDVMLAVNAEVTNILNAGFSIALDPGDDDLLTVILALPGDDEYTMQHTIEREMHHVAATAFSTYFGTAGNGLIDGDTLAIAYADLETRRQSVPGSATTPAASLFKTTDFPEKIPYCVPICKRIGDDLVFIDGTVVRDEDIQQSTVLFGQNGYALDAVVDTQWNDSSYLAAATTPWTFSVQAALNSIISDLALETTGASGANRVGSGQVDAPVKVGPGWSGIDSTFVAGSISEQFTELNWWLNQKAQVGGDETISGNWTFSANNTFSGDNLFNGNLSHDFASQVSPGDIVVHHGRTLYETHAGGVYYGETRLLGGFILRNEESGVANGSVYMGPGHALINGKHVVLEQGIELTRLDLKLMEGANVSIGDFDMVFYYIWLRSDGTFWLDDQVPTRPTGDWFATPTFFTEYKPADTHTGTWTPDDYCLVNVVWSLGCASSIPKFRPMLPAGGNLWVFPDLDNHIYQVAKIAPTFTNTTGTTALRTALSGAGTVGCPGIPDGITNTALLELDTFSISLAASAETQIQINSQYAGHSNLWRSAGIHMFADDTTPDTRQTSGIVPGVLSDGLGGVVGHFTYGIGSGGGDWSLRCFGFMWDRTKPPGSEVITQN